MLVLPSVPAVIPVLPQFVDDIHALARDADLDMDKLSTFVEKSANARMRPMHDLQNPYVRRDPGGAHAYYMLWSHPMREHASNPDFMTAIEFRLRKNTKGENMYAPETVLRGPLANTLIIGGMQCCGALQAHWTQRHDDGTFTDHAMAPSISYLDPEHNFWLKGKVRVASSAEGKGILSHLLMDILADRYPDQYGHDCSSQTGYSNLKAGGAAVPTAAPR